MECLEINIRFVFFKSNFHNNINESENVNAFYQNE